jgi:H+-translocating NAD(P) transhydrogenase subunit alpha
MKIAIPKELHPGETRTAMIPVSAAKLVKLGAEVMLESGAGSAAGFTDQDYINVGVSISSDRSALIQGADMILRLRKPPLEELDQIREGVIHVSFLDPFNEKELVQKFADRKISAISMELIPRTTRAQKMDALSSQANLAGYVAVITAANYLPKIFPMMMTAAGTITPARVFIIGAGVAGLQAIATAKRLGARVEAYDTRPVVEEQVKSLGAKFVKLNIGETGQTKDGYAKALTEEQLNKQREEMKKYCSSADIVVTTAQVFGRKAPVIVTRDMIEAMSPGSVVVDLAVESGGNVEGVVADQVTDVNGVQVVGIANLPGRVANHASQVYSANLVNLIEEFWDKDSKTFQLKREDDIIQGALVTCDGSIVNERVMKQ